LVVGPWSLLSGVRRAHREEMSDVLVAEKVRKVYQTAAGEVEALRGLDLTVAEGEFVAVMGPSGCGKTTLLNCLSGLDDIDGGSVTLDGRRLHEMSDAERTRDRARSLWPARKAARIRPAVALRISD
jgi:putative ABC transport system ATP-binding protein